MLRVLFLVMREENKNTKDKNRKPEGEKKGLPEIKLPKLNLSKINLPKVELPQIRKPKAESGKRKKSNNKAVIYLRRILTLARKKRRRGKSGKLLVVRLESCGHILLFPALFIYCEILLRAFTGTGVFQHLIYPVIFGLAAGFGFSALTSVFPAKINRIISTVLLFLTGLLFTVECLVRKSFQVYMTLGSIKSGTRGVVTGFGTDFFRAVYTGIPVILLFFLPLLLYIFLGRKYVPAWQYRIPFAAFLLVAGLLFFGVGAVAASHGSAKARYTTQYEFDASTQVFGLITGLRLENKYSGSDDSQGFVLAVQQTSEVQETSDTLSETAEAEGDVKLDAGVYSRELQDFSSYGTNSMSLDLDQRIAADTDETVKELDTYVNSLTASSKNAYTGLFEGKNLIMICAEAYCDAVVSEELTPTLYRLIHNGIYFSDFYQPAWGGSTSTGEYSMLMGIAPLDGVDTILEVQDHNLYFTLGNQLQREGYFSECYHNGEYDFYSRQLTHENLGYSTFLALGNGLEDLTGWYPSDAKMFDITMDTYMSKQPFSVYYMTIDGHCTYDADDELVEEYLDTVIAATGGKYKDTTNYYLCYQMGLEKALKVMVEKLEEAGIADDTVICLTGDHYPYGLAESSTFHNSQDYILDLYGYDYTKASWLRDHNNLIIWSGCLENENKDMACEIADPAYTLDIVPTLSNLFGLEFDSRLLVGRDVFSDADPLVLWNSYSWITDKGKYNSATETFEPNEGVTVADDYVESINAIVKNKLVFSDAVVDTDYYAELFGPDTNQGTYAGQTAG